MAAEHITIEQRKAFLRSSATYYGSALKFATNLIGADAPTCFPTIFEDNGLWTAEIRFASGHVFSFRDDYIRSKQELMRTVTYDFRLAGEPDEIFRIDSHGHSFIDSQVLHLEKLGERDEHGNKIRYYEDSPVLRGYSLRNITFCDVAAIIDDLIKGNGTPWV